MVPTTHPVVEFRFQVLGVVFKCNLTTEWKREWSSGLVEEEKLMRRGDGACEFAPTQSEMRKAKTGIILCGVAGGSVLTMLIMHAYMDACSRPRRHGAISDDKCIPRWFTSMAGIILLTAGAVLFARGCDSTLKVGCVESENKMDLAEPVAGIADVIIRESVCSHWSTPSVCNKTVMVPTKTRYKVQYRLMSSKTMCDVHVEDEFVMASLVGPAGPTGPTNLTPVWTTGPGTCVLESTRTDVYDARVGFVLLIVGLLTTLSGTCTGVEDADSCFQFCRVRL